MNSASHLVIILIVSKVHAIVFANHFGLHAYVKTTVVVQLVRTGTCQFPDHETLLREMGEGKNSKVVG